MLAQKDCNVVPPSCSAMDCATTRNAEVSVHAFNMTRRRKEREMLDGRETYRDGHAERGGVESADQCGEADADEGQVECQGLSWGDCAFPVGDVCCRVVVLLIVFLDADLVDIECRFCRAITPN